MKPKRWSRSSRAQRGAGRRRSRSRTEDRPMMKVRERALVLQLQDARLQGDLAAPDEPHGIVVFVHGSGSSRRSSRNRHVASILQRNGFATLLFDLLTEQEDARYE